MARARENAAWNRASLLAALIHNGFCASKTDLKKPSDFHPYHEPRRRPESPMAQNTGALLVNTFVNPKSPNP